MEQELKAEIEMTTVLADEMSVSRAEIIRSDKLYRKLKQRMYVSPLLQLQKGIYNLRGRFADMGGVEGIAKNVLVDMERSDRPFADDYTIEQFAEGVTSGLEELLNGTENEGLLDIGNLPLKENELTMLHEDTLSVWGLSGLNDEYWDELQEQAIRGGFVFKRPPKTRQQLALEMQLQVARELELSDNPEDWSFADKMDISFELGQKGYNRDGTPNNDGRRRRR